MLGVILEEMGRRFQYNDRDKPQRDNESFQQRVLSTKIVHKKVLHIFVIESGAPSLFVV